MFWCAWLLFTTEKMDQRICIQFCVKVKLSAPRLTRAFGKSSLSQKKYTSATSASQKAKKLLMMEPVLDVPACQQLMKSFEAVEKKNILENRRITIREVVEDVGKLVGSCLAIFSDVLAMKHVVAKFVAKLVNFDQNNHRLNITQELLNDFDDPDLLKRVITGNETWDMDMTSILRLN